MSGFEQLPQAIVPQVLSQVPAENVAWKGEELDDATALGIVLADVEKCEAYVSSKNLIINWELADNDFRAIGVPRNWPGTDKNRAGLNMPVVLEAVEKLMPAIMLGFFSDKKPFLLEGFGRTKPDVLRARGNLLLWAIKESGFKEEVRKSLKQCLLYGFTTLRWGWKRVKRTKRKYAFEQGGKKVVRQDHSYEISHPTIEAIEPRNVFHDSQLREQDCRKGRFSCVQLFPDASDIDALRDDPTYKNIPTREELTAILAQQSEPTTDSMAATKYITHRELQAQKQTEAGSVDPTKAKLEILEYVTCDRIITVLQRKIVIRNDENDGQTGFLSSAYIDVVGSMYGLGVDMLCRGEQYLQTHVTNKWMDALDLQVTPAFTAEQGLQTTAQNVIVRTGGVIAGPELKPIQIPDVGPAAQAAIQASETRAARRVGANGGDNMPTQALRTAEGVNSFGQDVVNKLQYFIEIYAEQVFIPALKAFLQVMHDNLQPDEIKQILSDMDAKAYEGDMLDVYNAECDVLVLSSTKLAARRAAAQLIPLLLQLVSADPVQQALAAQGKKFDFAELIEEAVDLAGWDVGSLIVPASPQEVQRAMTMAAPQAAKAQMDVQGKQQLLAQAHQNDLEKIEENGIMRAGVDTVKHVLKESSEESGIPIG